MNTLVMEPITKKKVQRKDHSIPEVLSSLKIVYKKPIDPTPNLDQAIDLFKNNADFIDYGLSSMMTLP